MSIIVALVDGDCTHIGSDTLAISTYGQYYNVGEKWCQGANDWWIGHVGDSRVADIIRVHAKFLTQDANTPDEIITRLIPTLEEERVRPHYPGDTTVPVWISGAIIARPGEAWEVDTQLCLTPVLPGKIAARGAGADIAIGAAWIMMHSGLFDLSSSQIISRVIEAAQENNINVRGRWLKTLKAGAVD